jgi:isocitrate/isopropylmalate dehydrogenase
VAGSSLNRGFVRKKMVKNTMPRKTVDLFHCREKTGGFYSTGQEQIDRIF